MFVFVFMNTQPCSEVKVTMLKLLMKFRSSTELKYFDKKDEPSCELDISSFRFDNLKYLT